MFNKKKTVPKAVPKIAVPAPVQAEEEVEEVEEETEELPEMPNPEPKPLSREEVLDLIETSISHNANRQLELLKYVRTLK